MNIGSFHGDSYKRFSRQRTTVRNLGPAHPEVDCYTETSIRHVDNSEY